MAAERSSFDGSGRLRYLLDGGEELSVRTSFGAAAPGWKRIITPWQSQRQTLSRNSQGVWRGSFEVGAGNIARVIQTISEKDGFTQIDLKLTAEADLDMEGIYFWIELPRAEFAGGTVEDMPLIAVKPAGHDLLKLESQSLQFKNAQGTVLLEASLDQPHPIFIEDNWRTSGRTYAARIEIHKGSLLKGSTANIQAGLRLTAKPESSPAHLQLDSSKRRYQLNGFGGNYCFNVDSPVTQYTLRNLRLAWARTEMKLAEWAPANDKPGSRIHNDFLIQKQLMEKRIPYVISIWQLPEEMYSDPGPKMERRSGRHIAADQWDALLNSIGEYLQYGKLTYGVEPDLFSFNEANIGIDVLLTPEEHRDAIKRIGSHLAALGLKTKMLLADATGPRGTHEYALAAANDPEAMKYVAAIGFHSWGGASAEQYRAWGDLAEWLNLPLLVAELGLDAQAYRGRMYDSYYYGIQEVKMYQELLLHARPQAAIYWEYTADYSTLRLNGEQHAPTHRFWFLKHFSDLTPADAYALGTESDNPRVLFTAFEKDRQYVLHVANFGSGRTVNIAGIPESVRTLRPVRTSELDEFKELPAMAVADGKVQFDMPLRSLVTLVASGQ